MNSAVLLIVFNRPDPTRKVFEAVREAKPPRLYIAADGPRPHRADDEENCRTVREILATVDWECGVFTLFRERNLGCRAAVSGAINWFFEQEPEGIILEDDCLPLHSFFPYCDELLERFRHDERIAQICGSAFVPGPNPADSYYFSKYADIWGWASWRRAWQKSDMTMSQWPQWRDSGALARLPGSTPALVDYWTKTFDLTHAGAVDTWDYQWMFNCWQQGLVSIFPRETMINNIGWGADATHTINGLPSYARPAVEMEFPLVHSANVPPDPDTERNIARTRYFLNRRSEFKALVRRIPLVARLSGNRTERRVG